MGPGQKVFSLQRAVFSLHVHLFSLHLKCILSGPFLRLHVWVLRAWWWGEVGDGSRVGVCQSEIDNKDKVLSVLEAGEICSVWSSRSSSVLEDQSILDKWRRKEPWGEAKVDILG